MKLNTRAFAIAQTVAAAILYLVCSFFVAFLPEAAARLGGYAFHADLSGIMRPLSVSSFAVGLLVVSIGWGLLALIMASVYNGLTKDAASNQTQRKG
jgi:hypothetical protein